MNTETTTDILETVTCFLVRDDQLLLQRRPQGRIWAGLLNGPGGKIAPGEDLLDAVKREIMEETALKVHEVNPRGRIVLDVPELRPKTLAVNLFECDDFSGEADAREGDLIWYPVHALPFAEMWADQRHWLPSLLQGFSVTGEISYEAKTLRLASADLRLSFNAQS